MERADEIETHLRLLAVASDPMRANEIACSALHQELHHPAFYVARARWLQLNNYHVEALNEFQQALHLAPRNADLLDEIGLALLGLGRIGKAMSAFDASIGIAPARAQTYYHKGCACSAAGESGQALRAHERAIALEPGHVDALAAAAAIAARAGDTAKANAFAEKALRLNPGNPTATIARAMCHLQGGQFDFAETRLAALLGELHAKDQTRALALGLLADALDGQGRTEAAFEAYAEKNSILTDLYVARFAGPSRLLSRLDRLIVQMEGPSPMMPAGDPAPLRSAARGHVFLLGFMRSGTTLLEHVLATDPNVEALEERETLAGVVPGYLGADPENYSLPSGDGLDRARDEYWRRVLGFGANPLGKTFIDKQPFNTLYLPLIARLFPSAKIVFLVRDPRDVILSCFRRHLEIKPTTFELLDLAGAARFYDRVMHFAELCRAKLSLNVFECRYEDMISDFDNVVPAICRFVGADWSASMGKFDVRARSRNFRSVSGIQVRKGLYFEGIGQWSRYKTQLAPIIPLLKPWIMRFGYDAD